MGEFGEFGEIIKRLREEAELTQEREAKLMHISRSNVAMYESGTRRPSRETLEAFADFYNVDIDYLLGRSSKTTRARGAGYYFGPATVVGHNVKFDLKFLYCAGWNPFDGRRRYYDTCQLARTVLLRKGYPFTDRTDYDVENYKLTTLCDFYRIRDNAGAHRSLSDAYATAILFRHLAEAKAKN